MRLIDADKLPRILAPIAPVVKGEAIHYENIVFCKDINEAPTIAADEGVKIIWSAQIEDLVEKMKERSRFTADTDENGGMLWLNDVIAILEDAKG